MPRLFVDCDDTLIQWLDEWDNPIEGQNPYGGGSQKWQFNDAILGVILTFEIQDYDITIWSGGGERYAQSWINHIERRLGRPLNWRAMGKSMETIRISSAEDVAIDDMAESIKGFNGVIHHPRYFDTGVSNG